MNALAHLHTHTIKHRARHECSCAPAHPYPQTSCTYHRTSCMRKPRPAEWTLLPHLPTQLAHAHTFRTDIHKPNMRFPPERHTEKLLITTSTHRNAGQAFVARCRLMPCHLPGLASKVPPENSAAQTRLTCMCRLRHHGQKYHPVRTAHTHTHNQTSTQTWSTAAYTHPCHSNTREASRRTRLQVVFTRSFASGRVASCALSPPP
jgi:hypothetical protein